MTHTSKPWETGHFGELQEDDELEFGRIYGPGENTIVCDVYNEKDMVYIAALPELLEAIDKIGSLLCDGVVGKMVKSGSIIDGPCEALETETGLALIVVGYLFKEFSKIVDPVRKKVRGE